MRRYPLGDTPLLVSKLCFGTLTMSPLQTNMSPEDGAALLIHAYEHGINFLDTADLYGTYPHIRLALKEAPDYIVSSKAYCYDEETARAALERAWRGIGRDYIDLFMLHEQESLYTLKGHEEALIYLEKQRERGYIGAIGVSTHFVRCVSAVHRFPIIRVVHPLINMSGIGIQDGTRVDMENAIQNVRPYGVGIFAMKPLGGGHLIAQNAEALHYALNAPFLDSIAVGMQSRREIDANCAFAEELECGESLMEPLAKRERRIMVHDWCEGCGSCMKRCKQQAISIVDKRAVIDSEKCVFCGYCARSCPQFCIKVV
ncbi:MAG: aldo/keto reductase [Clostridia bacterium]|nr:aldo/keto reductase [Clostridia bacterium]